MSHERLNQRSGNRVPEHRFLETGATLRYIFLNPVFFAGNYRELRCCIDRIKNVDNPRERFRFRSFIMQCSSTGTPVPVFWYGDLKPCPFPGHSGFGDSDPGDREDLTGEEEAKAGVVPEAPLEQTFPVLR